MDNHRSLIAALVVLGVALGGCLLGDEEAGHDPVVSPLVAFKAWYGTDSGQPTIELVGIRPVLAWDAKVREAYVFRGAGGHDFYMDGSMRQVASRTPEYCSACDDNFTKFHHGGALPSLLIGLNRLVAAESTTFRVGWNATWQASVSSGKDSTIVALYPDDGAGEVQARAVYDNRSIAPIRAEMTDRYDVVLERLEQGAPLRQILPWPRPVQSASSVPIEPMPEGDDDPWGFGFTPNELLRGIEGHPELAHPSRYGMCLDAFDLLLDSRWHRVIGVEGTEVGERSHQGSIRLATDNGTSWDYRFNVHEGILGRITYELVSVDEGRDVLPCLERDQFPTRGLGLLHERWQALFPGDRVQSLRLYPGTGPDGQPDAPPYHWHVKSDRAGVQPAEGQLYMDMGGNLRLVHGSPEV